MAADHGGGVGFGPRLVGELHPFHVVLDRDLAVVHFGPRAAKVCPGIRRGTAFHDLFTIHRPRVELSFDAIRRTPSTFLVDANETRIRLRGPMLHVQEDGAEHGVLVFLGTPWFTEMDELQRSRLELRDFSLHDPIVEFLYMVQAKTVALADATKFSATISEQRDELQRTNDELARASAAKSQFLANTSHELRTPLNGIMGMAAVLLLEDLPRRHRNYAEKILGSAKSLLVVVNDVLDFSKIEAGKLTLQEIEFDLRDVLYETAELFAVAAHEKGVEVSCFVSPDVATTFVGDPGRLRQIVSNLAGNAVKFTQEGEIAIRASVASDEHGPVLEVSVSDTGIGLDEGARAKLFAAFSQADDSMSRKYGGTGLGLAISRQLVTLMGGEIDVESTRGAGSRFFFTARLAPGTPVEPRGRSLLGRRVLVCAQGKSTREDIHAILTHAGASVLTVADPHAAAAALMEAGAGGRPYDAALLDMSTRGMTGLAIAGRITEDPNCNATRIVLLYSIAQPDPAQARARVDAVVSKPLRAGKLLDAVAATRRRSTSSGGFRIAAIDLVRAAPGGARSAGHILVVEDHPVNREVATAMLEALGCTSDVATNGREALTALEARSYDAVLMDLQMPELDGYDAALEIRRREGRRKRVPIIALSAHAMETDRRKALDAGMDDYLSKPVEFDVLSKALERWLGRSGGKEPAPVASPAPAAPRAASIDPSALDQLRRYQRKGGKDLVAEIVAKYLEDLPERAHAMRTAFESADAPGLAAPAHALKSSSAIVGAKLLAQLAGDLESAARDGDVARANAIYHDVADEVGRVGAELEIVLHAQRGAGSPQ